MQFKKEKLQHIPNTTCPECHHTNTILKDHHHAEQVCEHCGAILNPTEKRETQKEKGDQEDNGKHNRKHIHNSKNNSNDNSTIHSNIWNNI